jgi:hypothetical protein
MATVPGGQQALDISAGCGILDTRAEGPKMTTDPIREYLATARQASLQTAAGAEALQRAVHQRWSVKTGADAGAANLVAQLPVAGTIAGMVALAVPAVLPPDARSPGAEETVWELNATLTGYKHESDGDYHLVIADGQGNTMIAEIPDPAALAPDSFFAQQITAARQAFDNQFGLQLAAAAPSAAPQFAAAAMAPALIPASESVTVRGLGFFDFAHGQDGVAPNAIELHPVISIEFHGPATAAPPPQAAGIT